MKNSKKKVARTVINNISKDIKNMKSRKLLMLNKDVTFVLAR